MTADTRQRSAVVFGARNIGRAVIDLLVANDWAVGGVARSQSTIDGIREAGAMALSGDVTDPANVHACLEQVGAAHGGVDLVVNAAVGLRRRPQRPVRRRPARRGRPRCLRLLGRGHGALGVLVPVRRRAAMPSPRAGRRR